MHLQCAACQTGFIPSLWDNRTLHNMASDSVPVEVPPPAETGPEPTVDPAVREELELVSRARQGDTAAFSTLLRRYEGKIFRLAMNITQNREDAEDVLQEAFLKAYEHLDQFQ